MDDIAQLNKFLQQIYNGLYRDMYNFDDINFGNFSYVIIKV